MKRAHVFAIAALALATFAARAEDAPPKAGDVAPAFAAKDQDGKLVKLEDLKGKRVVLWFYPKADTPG